MTVSEVFYCVSLCFNVPLLRERERPLSPLLMFEPMWTGVTRAHGGSHCYMCEHRDEHRGGARACAQLDYFRSPEPLCRQARSFKQADRARSSVRTSITAAYWASRVSCEPAFDAAVVAVAALELLW